MALPFHVIDAFTGEPFSGNPAGVVLLDGPRPDSWMQAVAREVNHAETAFLLREGAGYRLRWFTPAVEVDLCGHATLASAHFLWDTGSLGRNQEARFQTRSGELRASPNGDWIALDFPATPPEPCNQPEGLLQALGLSEGEIRRTRFDYLVVMADPGGLRRLSPDLRALREFPVRGVIVTAPSDHPEADFLSRFFGPQSGVDEDPVTGSAHCALAPFWAGRLGRNGLVGYQASSRGGYVKVEANGERVRLSGQAVTTIRGTLAV